MNAEPVLEIQHKRQQSHDSGTYQDWPHEDIKETSYNSNVSGEFVTVVAVETNEMPAGTPFVTVVAIDPLKEVQKTDNVQEVLVYRLPGERLGFGLKFEGGLKATEKVSRLFIQSCADDSPASRTCATWGPLSPGDEIVSIDGVLVNDMTRMDCVRALKDSNVVIKLVVARGKGKEIKVKEESQAPPIPPRKFPRKKEITLDPPHGYEDEWEKKSSPPIIPRSRFNVQQAEVYTDLLAEESVLPTESESDDTGSSISTVVSRISSTPTTSNSSFSDARSINSMDITSPPTPPTFKNSPFDLDKVLEPFLRLEREFSSVTIDENEILSKLAEARSIIDSQEDSNNISNIEQYQEIDLQSIIPEIPCKPTPRLLPENSICDKQQKSAKKRPPPPPPPRTDRPICPDPSETISHLPRLIDFVPKDRIDVVFPSPKHGPQTPEKEDEKPNIPENVADQCTGQAKMLSRGLSVPPSFSRLPPDGHEFPVHYNEAVFEEEPNEHKNSYPLKVGTVNPYSQLSIPLRKTSLPGSETPKLLISTLWRTDEKSDKSVRDKIAMFSTGCSESNYNTQPKKLNKFKSSDDITSKIKLKTEKNLFKKGMPYHSMLDVTDTTIKEFDKIESCTQSTNDLSNEMHISFSTLPRKTETRTCQGKKIENPQPALVRAVSFSGASNYTTHLRSQSLLDVSTKPPYSTKIEDSRKNSLNNLIEQRKKSISKLRGLVIPEKVVEVTTQFITDLPEIQSKDCPLPTINKTQTEKRIDDKAQSTVIRKPIATIPVPPWKGESYDFPKYSPAFKRKSLALIPGGATTSVSSVSSSLSSSREELRSFNDAKIYKPNSNEPKSLESITSPSDQSYDSLSLKISDSKCPIKIRNDSRTEEESDNDSAVSSSRSSVSHGYSPPHSPILHDNSMQSNVLSLKRTLSSETTASTSSIGSTLTSGSQGSISSTSSSIDSRRVLKPQSVEAINRKNVLTSAKYSSGLDVKVPTDRHKDGETDSNHKEDSIKDTEPLIYSQDYKNEIITDILKSKIDVVDSLLENSADSNEQLTKDSSDDLDVSDTSKTEDNDWSNGFKHVNGNKIDYKVSKILKVQNQRPNVNAIKKVFEKSLDNYMVSNGRLKNSYSNNNLQIQHPRVSSIDSTTSDDSYVPTPTHYGSATNLQKEQQFGSITSLASSTSLISQQELSQLIEEANQALEDGGNSHEVVVVILHRDSPGGSIGITLAGGADYEVKEITVYKVLAGSPAERDGRIQKGDRVLSINGKSMKGLTHYESLSILKAPRPEVVLVVSRHKSDIPEDTNPVSPRSTASSRLLKLNEMKYTSLTTEKPSLIGGCADKSNELHAGDRIISVNNVDLSEMSRIEAWAFMKQLPDGQVHLYIRRPIV